MQLRIKLILECRRVVCQNGASLNLVKTRGMEDAMGGF
jgi:hypothetical protein